MGMTHECGQSYVGGNWSIWLERHTLLDVTRILALQTGRHHRKCLNSRGYSDSDFRKTYH